MFYTKEKRDAILNYIDAKFDFESNLIDAKIQEAKDELLNIILATAMAGKIKPKAVADNFSIEKLHDYMVKLHSEIVRRINQEKEKAAKKIKESLKKAGVKNVYGSRQK